MTQNDKSKYELVRKGLVERLMLVMQEHTHDHSAQNITWRILLPDEW